MTSLSFIRINDDLMLFILLTKFSKLSSFICLVSVLMFLYVQWFEYFLSQLHVKFFNKKLGVKSWMAVTLMICKSCFSSNIFIRFILKSIITLKGFYGCLCTTHSFLVNILNKVGTSFSFLFIIGLSILYLDVSSTYIIHIYISYLHNIFR